jgi:hypothetical protein
MAALRIERKEPSQVLEDLRRLAVVDGIAVRAIQGLEGE